MPSDGSRDREIRCRDVLTANGWNGPSVVRLEDAGRVESVEALDAPDDADGLAGVIVPGMPNLHSHAFQRQMAGLAEHGSSSADSFWTWRERMYRLANAVTRAQFEALAGPFRQAMQELL